MTNQHNNKNSAHANLTLAYRTMIERVWHAVAALDKKATPVVNKAIEIARAKAVFLEELSQEEAEKVSLYLQRDLHDAANYLDKTGHDLKEWLAFDWMLIEDKLWEYFSTVADKTTLELQDFNQALQRSSPYHAHEISGMGTLQCGHCGHFQHFHEASAIRPCPKCQGLIFIRVNPEKRTT